MYSNCLYLVFSSGIEPNAFVMDSSCGVRLRLSMSLSDETIDKLIVAVRRTLLVTVKASTCGCKTRVEERHPNRNKCFDVNFIFLLVFRSAGG